MSRTAIGHVTAISQLILTLAAPPIVTKGLVLTTTLAAACVTVGATLTTNQALSPGPQKNQISITQFKLLMQPRGFLLQFVSDGKIKRIAIPRNWLIPQDAEKEEKEGAYVSSFNYDSQVQSFPIGNGRIGLHLSSYDFAKGGTSYAAAGRDVFLVFDPMSQKILQGGLRSGITKGRGRAEGCLSVAVEHYYLADVDGDGLTDIGVLREEFQCIEGAGRYGNIAGPFYKQDPVAWYLFKNDGWKLEPSLLGKAPERLQELPLIGIGRTPADVVACGLSPNCDRARWPHEIHTETAHGVTAHFGGQEPANNLPLRLGVEALWFTFANDPENYGFPSSGQDGELYFSDWTLDIFSPDGAYVLLLQDHYGPYHVVATAKLKEYLTGHAKPDYVVTNESRKSAEPAQVHHDGHWISSREIQFKVSCCGSTETLNYTLPRN